MLPKVRGALIKHVPRYLTRIAIDEKLKHNKYVSLRDALRLFRKEMRSYNLGWKFLFSEDNKSVPFHIAMKQEIQLSQHPFPWQAVIPTTNTFAERLWRQFNDQDKTSFLKYAHRYWLNHRSSIPPVNANLLLQLANENRLSMHSGVKNIYYHYDLNAYVTHFGSQETLKFDWIINATGPSKHTHAQDGLLYHLIQDGSGRRHPYGGLDVEFETSALINSQGQANPRIRLIGQNTTGVYQYTSSLELIAKKSVKVAYDFVTFIKEVHHDKNTTPVSSYLDWASRPTQTLH